METHRRIKHVDVIKFGCNKCDFNSSTKSSLDTHEMSHQEEVHSCNECDFVTQTIGNLQEHKTKEHAKVQPVKCGKCTFNTDSATDLENHMKSTHAIDKESITCGICIKIQTNMCPLTTRKCIHVAIVNLNQKKRTKSASMVLKSIKEVEPVVNVINLTLSKEITSC